MRLSFSKCLSIFLPFCLIMSAYVFPFASWISLDYIFFIVFGLILVVKKIRDGKLIMQNTKPLLLSLILVFISIVTLFINNYEVSNYTYTFIVKTIVWGIIISFSNEYIDRKIFVKSLIFVSTISTIYLLIQSILFYGLSIKMPNGFNFGIFKYSAINSSDLPINYYRPCSFYSEPAYYSTNVLISLLYLLFDTSVVFKSRRVLLILHFSGILLSASTAGIFLFLLLLIFYLYKNRKNVTKKKMAFSLIIIIATSLVLLNYEFILSHMGSLGNTVLKSINKVNNYEHSSRIGGSFNYLNNLDNNSLLFGYGLGNEYFVNNGIKFYMNAFTRTMLQCGIFGIALISLNLMIDFCHSKSIISKYIIIMIVAKCLTGNMLFSCSGIFAFTIVYFEIYYMSNKRDGEFEHE